MNLNEKRILLVDDTKNIHEDFRKILGTHQTESLFDKTKSMLFSEPADANKKNASSLTCTIDSAYQGEEALQLVKKSLSEGRPYALAFVDIRMPPGWDGVETIEKIWQVDSDIQIVICTAYSDYSWKEISTQLQNSDNFLILKKPFDPVEIYQLVAALTKKWELKHRVNQQIETLEATVQERTAALRRAKEIAINANHLKNQFLENMSHELRTPLQSIIGFSELIRDEKIPPSDYKEYCKDILLCAKNLSVMVDDMLDLSNIESGKLEFHPEHVNLSLLIHEIKAAHHSIIKENNLEFDIKIDPQLTNIVTDPIKLKQVFYHYISNAIKFTPDGGKIEVHVSPENDTQFRIEVVDTGIGVSKEDIDKLFVLFQQLDSSMSKKYAGVGIGLALIRHIVEAQGGKVGIENSSNKGSTFYAVLPLESSK